jgi:hypothetical protein
VTSLPTYPAAMPRDGAERSETTNFRISPRAKRVSRELALLAAIAAMCALLRHTASSLEKPPVVPPRRPLDFELIQQRFDKVRTTLEYSQVVELLGPPSPWGWKPEFQRIEDRVAVRPDRYPSGPRTWEIWVDPKDDRRWVAVFFIGGIACEVLKRGF